MKYAVILPLCAGTLAKKGSIGNKKNTPTPTIYMGLRVYQYYQIFILLFLQVPITGLLLPDNQMLLHFVFSYKTVSYNCFC